MENRSVFLYIHLLWQATPDSTPLKPAEIAAMTGTLKQVAADKAVELTAVAVLPNHVHVILALQPIQLLHQLVQSLMQQSEQFINTIRTNGENFAWQQPWYAFSVSPNTLARAKDYLAHQQQWHTTKTVDEEIAAMLKMVEEG